MQYFTLMSRGGVLEAETLPRMVALGAGFRGVTLYDVTPFIKIMSKSR